MMLNHEPGSSRPPHSFHPGTSPARTGTGGMGAWTWGVEERGGGKGRYSQLRHLSGWIQGPVPRWPTTPRQRLEAPRSAHPTGRPGITSARPPPGQPRFRAQKLDPTRSSWSSCRSQGGGSYRWTRPFARCAQGCASCMEVRAPEPREG